MSLTNRLSVLFLSMLAIVICGFSSTLYLLTSHYLLQQAAQQVAGASNVIGIVAEPGPDGVEWELGVANSNLDSQLFEGRIAWLVVDHMGAAIEQSNAIFQSVELNQRLLDIPKSLTPAAFDSSGRSWIAFRQEVSSPISSGGSKSVEVKRIADHGEVKLFYPALSIVVALDVSGVYSNLRRFGSVLAILSLTIWLTALLLSRVVCHRALLPLRNMAQSAVQIDAENLSNQRLPHIDSKDELAILTTSFNELLDRLQISFERQRTFVGEASHQLRTPLTAILGQIEVAMRRERSIPEYRETLQTVHRRTIHLNKIVESLLFLAQTDSDAATPRIECIELTSWLPNYIESWSGHERFGSIQLESHVDEGCEVRAQSIMLAESLNVLIDNAIKYSPANTTVAIRLCRVDGTPQVQVLSRGHAISPEDERRLFEPFFRSETIRTLGIPGLGLGLSLAKRLTSAFNATLSFSRQPDAANCFVIAFQNH